MRKVLIPLVVVGLILILKTPIDKRSPNIKTVSPTRIPVPTIIGERLDFFETEAVFIPEWNLLEETILHNGYDRWIYFGSSDKMDVFSEALPNRSLWMTVKATSVEELEKINTRDFNLQKFKGIVLDLEINGIATEKLVAEINSEVRRIYTDVKKSDLKFALALYGDLFYRKRPYDLKSLNGMSDEIMIMAYDFHKSYGEPGPNYPYSDFMKMVDDYTEVVPPEKITVIFGMYGYNWTLRDGKPLKPATSMTLAQIKSGYLGKKCYETDCKVIVDEQSKEKMITYKDDKGDNHVVYFEDEESVELKKRYLREKGIGSTAYWAWGYF